MALDLFSETENEPSRGFFRRITMQDADILYFPRLFSRSEADRLFGLLLSEVLWRQEKITLYGQIHDIPRLTAWYGDIGKSYTYSGIKLDAHPWIASLLEIRERIRAVSDTTFNSVLLNRYRNGSDSVSWHADDEPELGTNPVIGSVSLGQFRHFQMKHKTNKDLKQKVGLEHGSYLLMRGPTQHNWFHQVAKSKKEPGERINLTFRNVD